MKLRYLGTAAAEGWPAVYCNCEYCLRAKELGGKDIRTRSQSLINDDLLLDFPLDTYHHIITNNLDFSKVKYCFVTHSHIDHFAPIDLIFRLESCYSHNLAEPMLTLYGNRNVLDKYKHFVTDTAEIATPPQVELKELKAYETVCVDDYRVTPLPANHKKDESAFVYLIQKRDKTLLYLHDTGLLYDEVYDYLEKNQTRADLISYDCTFAALESSGGHLGLDSVPYVRRRLTEIGVAYEKTVHIVNHFSHNGMLCHKEICERAEKIGFLTAYDGMEIEF